MPVHSQRISLPSPVLGRPRRLAAWLGGALLFVAPALQAQEPETPTMPALSAPPPGEVPATAGCSGTGQVGQGFVAFTGLGGRLASVAIPAAAPMQTMTGMMTVPTTTSTTATDVGAGPRWNLMLGYKLCRVVIGLNLDLLLYSPSGSSSTAVSFNIAPEVQISLARSRDARAELIGALSVGLGQAMGSFQLGGTVAPGLRYWVHRHIALSTLLGLGTSVTLQGKGATVLLNLQGTAGVLGAF